MSLQATIPTINMRVHAGSTWSENTRNCESEAESRYKTVAIGT